jgi:hypothetical protein
LNQNVFFIDVFRLQCGSDLILFGCRLLGPAAHDLPASASQALASTFRDTRVVVMDNGLGILTNSEEEQIDFVVCCLWKLLYQFLLFGTKNFKCFVGL